MSVGVESGFSNDELLHIRFPIHRACRDGDVGALCSLLQQCSASPEDLAAEDSFYGWTPIHWAAHFGKLECVLRLVQVGCEVNAVTSRFAQTPAHIAAFGGHPKCLLWLLQAGADINRQDYVGETPIHKAARAGSMECISALLISGAKPELRNANGLTAADVARAQGFQECAQLLSNAENQLKKLNGFGHNGTDHSHIQGRSLLNGAANRKRLLDCSEPSHTKKARTDSMDFPVKTLNGMGEEMESMHVESAPDNQSDGSIETTTGLRNGHAQQNNIAINGVPTNGHCHPSRTEPVHAETRSDMCGSLHLSGSPSSCVTLRPSWGTFLSDSSEHLHYGYYHGFGDTAEDLEDASSRHDHNTTVRIEQYYDQEVLSAMQLFHGS
ncbi:ankyrin repeat domain-containing protein 10a [Colossoma macropomum]|uniref:ankyrin repeat domain-containing protein 10a n=1 Tax=Colossoma macropomum TaxID=42526 RepID=UPI0018644DC3|nr:ankyrin repeat domain-containing protein 10a [Colossoma macropomum]